VNNFSADVSPAPLALRLGYAGVLPFVVGAAFVWLVGGNADAHAFAALVLSCYAAVIISFLGGLHWGLAMRQSPATMPTWLYAWGVIPSLVAWVAVVMPPYAGLVVHGVMLVTCYLVDRRTYPLLGAAPWLTLRFRLTVAASLSCFVGAAGS
jgi:hypothetical protein